MFVSLKLFETLDEIRESADISAMRWAHEANYGPARITELRNLCKLRTNNENAKIGTEWTYEKFNKLAGGLQNLMGKEEFIKKLKGKLKDLTLDERVTLKFLALTDEEKVRIEQVIDAFKPEFK